MFIDLKGIQLGAAMTVTMFIKADIEAEEAGKRRVKKRSMKQAKKAKAIDVENQS